MKKFEYSFKSIWTICSIIIIKEDDNWLNKIINSCYNIIQNFDYEFSRFRNDSILNKLNNEKKLEVSSDFLSLLNKSKDIYNLTKWYFNPLVNVERVWYTNSFDTWDFLKVKSKQNLKFENIKIYGNLVELEENMSLDFWSIAKWFLSDKLSNYLKTFWLNNFLVNMWWDIYVSGKNLENKNWWVAISSPFEEWKNIYWVELSDKSISTSWTYLRKWKIWAKDYHHIVNPFSAKQQQKLLSVSVIDDFWYKTDALATWLIAMWEKKALEFAKDNNLKYIFILEDSRILKNV